MRFFRFLALLLVIVLAYSAQFILHPPVVTTSTSVLPPPINDLLPNVSRLRALFAGDLRDLAFFMMAIAAVTFGLLAVPWSLTEPPLASVPATFVVPHTRRRHRLGWWLVVGALLLAIGASLLFWTQFLTYPNGIPANFGGLFYPLSTAFPILAALVMRMPWLTAVVWVASLFLFFIGCALFPWRFQQETTARAAAPGKMGKGATFAWRLFLVLLVAGLWYSWRLTTVPPLLDEEVAQLGLWANDWLHQGNPYFFAAVPVALESGLRLTGLAATMPALFFWLTQDLLLSVRLAGLWGGLLTIGATWLLGTELFRRTRYSIGETAEDQGQGPALLAAILVMMTMATILFSRLPVFMEMVGWGCLGCWALLRGLRTGDRLAIGVSGILLSLSALLYTLGLVFLITALCWWGGYLFVQSGWLPHRLQVELPAARFRGYFLLWVSGLWVMAAPTLGAHWFAQQQWLPLLQGKLMTHWQPTLLALLQPGDQSGWAGLATPFVHELLAPLLFLAVGALCFNFDRRITWLLLTWLVTAFVSAMLLPPTVPSWSALLPSVPALGLLLAFGLDRLRVTVLQSAGLWSNHLLNYLLLGLLVWVGANNGIEHYHFAQQQVDTVSALGQELQRLPAERPVIIIGSSALNRELPQLRFFTNDWQQPRLAQVTFYVTIPDEIPPGAVVLLAPADATLLAQLQLRYPNGTLLVRRDHLANLLLYHYTLPTG